MSQTPPVGNGPPKNGITTSPVNVGNSKAGKSKSNSKKDKPPDAPASSVQQPPALNNATVSSARSSRSLNKFLCCFCVSRTDQDHEDTSGEHNTKRIKGRGMGTRTDKSKGPQYTYRPAEQHSDAQCAAQSPSHCTSESGVPQLTCPAQIPVQLQSSNKDDIIKVLSDYYKFMFSFVN